MWWFVVMAFIVGLIASTITKTFVFEPFRDWIMRKNEKLGYLASCPYCLSFYVAVFPIIYFRPALFDTNIVINLFLSWFFLVSLNMISIIVCMKALKLIGEVK
jgi:hypothetical protein